MIYVGNDVVDLAEPRTHGRAAEGRFVARVFDPVEQEAIRAAADPDLELWARWAAKEAGFKVVSKIIGSPPPFVHRAFLVSWDVSPPGAAASGLFREGRVTYEGHVARVSVHHSPGCMQAVGFGSVGTVREAPRLDPRAALLDPPQTPWSGSLEELRARFTERELDAVYSLPSAAVRLGARAHVASLLAVSEERLEIVCDPGPTGQRPPRLMLDGAPTRADVSLSHDGRWIAWVFWTDQRPSTEDA